jgi:hypothetical protein
MGTFMRRYQLGLLAFCLALVLAIVLLFTYLGRAAAAMVVDGEQRSAPYYLFQWLPGTADTSAEPRSAYQDALMAVAAVDGGSLLWSTTSLRRQGTRSRRGSSRQPLVALDVIEFTTGIGLVQMLTNSEFRELDATLPLMPLRAGTAAPPRDLDPTAPALFILFEDLSVASASALVDPRGRGWLRALAAHGGRVSWQGDLTWWGTEAIWNRFLVLQFAQPDALERWLRDPDTRTGRALVSRELGDFLILRIPAQTGVAADERSALPDTRQIRPGSAS